MKKRLMAPAFDTGSTSHSSTWGSAPVGACLDSTSASGADVSGAVSDGAST